MKQLGAFPLPVEVVAFGHKTTARRLFDALAECEAAAASGMQVLLSIRPGNSEQTVSRFERISSFQDLELNP